ncbi:MAG: hypothetical protein HY602_00395, partial [Parcubacteria group bacterium]|nr:hypothetical protein [Parcubacteria group bacterium]
METKKKWLVIILIVALVFGSGVGVIFAMTQPVKIAPPKAVLSILNGGVSVKKSGENEWKPAYDGMELEEGDLLKTDLNTSAFVNFFDYASTRLDSDTEIALTKLQLDPKNLTTAKIRYEIEFGRIWARILNLLDRDSRFEITSEDTVATIRGTALSIEVPKEIPPQEPLPGAVPQPAIKPQPKKMVLQVIEGTVRMANSKTSELIKIKSGQKIAAALQKDVPPPDPEKLKEEPKVTKEIAAIEPVIREKKLEEAGLAIQSISAVEKQSEWFNDNQARDKAFLEQVETKKKEETKEQAGVLPGSPLYGVKQLAETVVLAATFNEDEKLKKEIEFTNKRVLEAAVLLSEDQKILGAKKLEDFQTSINNIIEKTKALEQGGRIEFAQQIQEQVNNALFIPQVLLHTALPDENLFKAKEALASAQFTAAIQPEKQLEKQLQTLKLNKNDLRDLIIDKKWDAAAAFINEIRDEYAEQDLIDIIDEIPIAEIAEVDRLRAIDLARVEKLELKFEERLPIEERKDGFVETLKDGSIQEKLPDGTIRTVKPNGDIEKMLPDGKRQLISKDGRFKEIAPDGATLERMETDGTIAERYTDAAGKVTEKTTAKIKANTLTEQEEKIEELIKPIEELPEEEEKPEEPVTIEEEIMEEPEEPEEKPEAESLEPSPEKSAIEEKPKVQLPLPAAKEPEKQIKPAETQPKPAEAPT